MQRKTSTIVIIILVIMLIAIGIFMLGEVNKDSSKKTTSTNTIKENTIENKIVNEIKENILTNEMMNTDTIVDNSENEEENTITSTEIFEEEPKTAEEKAINIVKEDWGEDKNVDISIDGIDSNSNYIVAVRDNATTEAKAFYIVNILDGTFTKKEMN